MNRLSFLKTITAGIAGAVITPKIITAGIAGAVITPKIITYFKKPPLKTCGIIPFLAREGARMNFDSRSQLNEGDVITTGSKEGIVRKENGNLIADMYPVITQNQFFWYRIESAISKITRI